MILHRQKKSLEGLSFNSMDPLGVEPRIHGLKGRCTTIVLRIQDGLGRPIVAEAPGQPNLRLHH